MSVLFKSRKAIACLPAICLLAVAIHSATHATLKITPKYDDTTVEIALIDPEELLPPPPEPEPEPVVEQPPPPPEIEEAEAQIEEPPPPPPKPKPPAPKPPPPKPKPQVVKAAPTPPKPQPVVQAPAPAPAAAPPAAAPVTRPVAQVPHTNPADQESRYTARLLAELERYKQYPRGREASLQRPEGNVVVWLLIDRSGKVVDSGIEKKAANMLLNRAAQTSLKRLDQVVPFPDNTFSGKDKYRFSATLVYNIEQ